MKNKLKLGTLAILSLIVITCTNDDVKPRAYPRVVTLEVSKITSSGAQFSAEITHPGSGDIVEYGFVWGEEKNPNVEDSEKKILDGVFNTGVFHTEISTTLKEGVNYFVRAYAKNDDYLVYGINLSFLSLGSGAPLLSSISPESGTLGDTVVITGKNFSYLNSNNIVSFGTLKSAVVESTDSTLLAIVPDDLMEENSRISVELQGNIALSENSFNLLAPEISGIDPIRARSADTLLIQAQNIGNKPNHPTVYFNDKKATVLNNSGQTIEVIVPDMLTPQTEIKVAVGNYEDKIDFDYLVPSINNFTPKIATWGDTIVASVVNFPDRLDLLKVFMNEDEYDIKEASKSKVTFVIPNEINKPDVILDFLVAGFELSFSEKLILKTPEIIELSPDTVMLGETLNLKVSNFHPSDNAFTIFDNNRPSGFIEVLNNSTSNFELRIPKIDYTNEDNILRIKANVGNGAFTINQNIIIKAPVISSFSPAVVANIGDEVSIYGKNFGSSPVVRFGDKSLEVIEAADSKIRVRIPSSFIRNELMTEFLEERIQVTAFERTGRSQTPLTIDYQTPWTFSNDNGLFDDNNFVFRQRTALTIWDDDEYGYLLGGRGRLKYSTSIPQGQEKLKDFWRFNPANDSWTRLRDWPQQNNQEEVIRAFSFNGTIYAFTDNDRALHYQSGNWSVLANTNIPAYQRYFEINNAPYIISGDSINLFQPSTGLMVKVIDFDSNNSCILSTYQYKGKQRVITCEGKEYVFDPLTQQISFIRSTSLERSVLESNGYYFIINTSTKELYSYDPSSGNTSLLSAFPFRPFFGLFIYNYFTIGDALYLRVAERRYVKYDFGF